MGSGLAPGSGSRITWILAGPTASQSCPEKLQGGGEGSGGSVQGLGRDGVQGLFALMVQRQMQVPHDVRAGELVRVACLASKKAKRWRSVYPSSARPRGKNKPTNRKFAKALAQPVHSGACECAS